MYRSSTLSTIAAAGLALAATTLSISPAVAVVPDSTSAINTDEQALALHGYDPVAYFTTGVPTRGDPKFAATHDGARYVFASEANLAAFKARPAAYLPQFGGFCAMGTSFGKKVDGDPTVWKIVDGKLYLNFNKDVGALWQTDIAGNIGRAEAAWPAIKDKAPSQLN
ncbi:MAG: YHS domain-containing (seleno)protein [Sphingomonadales bacterium]